MGEFRGCGRKGLIRGEVGEELGKGRGECGRGRGWGRGGEGVRN